MWEKNVFQRLGVIGIVILLALFFLIRFDPSTGRPYINLQPGLDIAGGTQLIFEIQDEDGTVNPQMAEQMKTLLADRVDPQGVYNLTWRVLGANRLEVQMPLPPKENAALRDEYIAALDQLSDHNILRGELEAALQQSAEQRAQAFNDLADGSTERLRLLNAAATAYDEYQRLLAERDAATQPVDVAPGELSPLDLALEELEDAKYAVFRTNLDINRLRDALELDKTSSIRKTTIKELREEIAQNYPKLTDLFEDVIAKFDKWRDRRVVLESSADLQRLIRGSGKLEFRILAEPTPENAALVDQYRIDLEEVGPRIQAGAEYGWFPIDNPLAFLRVDSVTQLQDMDPRDFESSNRGGFVVGKRGEKWYVLSHVGKEFGLLVDKSEAPWELTGAGIQRDERGRRAVAFSLDPVGASRFGQLTGNNINKQLCIFVDDTAYSSANIISRIRDRGQITGDFSTEKLQYLVQTMMAGTLPARLKDTPLSERTVDSRLGSENLQQALTAGIAGIIAVCVVMIVYYWISGLLANVALLLNVILVLAAMAMLGARMTLAGIAGVILTIGMTVDANVLIFERMREERDRGASLRMIIKNGYDKALSTILDANITTLLTCVIIYKVGSEQIKGFGLTLGWGIVTSLFTALFVTRTLFALLMRYNLIHDIKMLRMIGVPNIDWYSMRKLFVPLSVSFMAVGLTLLWFRGAHDALDVEFLGGINAEVQVHASAADNYNEDKVEERLETVGGEVRNLGAALANAEATAVEGDASQYRVEVPATTYPSGALATMLAEPLEAANNGQLIGRQGVQASTDDNVVLVRTKAGVSAEQLQRSVRGLAAAGGNSVVSDGDNIRRASFGRVINVSGEAETANIWSITTTATNKSLVQYALVRAFGDDLQTQPKISYTLRGPNGEPYPITERRLEAVIPEFPTNADITNFLGGAAIYLDEMQPPQSTDQIAARLKNMRLQPDFADLPWRESRVIGGDIAGKDPQSGKNTYSSMVIVVIDQEIAYDIDPIGWRDNVALLELNFVEETLNREQTLRKLTQFKPQIASQSQNQALLALVLSWMMIVGYLWLRFGKPTYGLAGVAALIHDVLIALAAVGISGWIGGSGHPIGYALLIDDFKINMVIVAAFLTIIGYSINDTIVVFDRIREVRGRIGVLTPEVINNSINQTLARTIMTSATTLIVLLTMYIFGGSSIRGFNFCLIIGVLTGTYSSIAVAAPLLMLRPGEEGVRRRHVATASS